MRPEADPFGGAVGAGDLDGLELGNAPEDRVARGVGLGTRERADAVDEPASGAQQPRGGGRDPNLQPGEARELVLAGPPQALWAPARGADPRARRIHQDAVEPASDGRPATVLHEQLRPNAEPVDVGSNELEARRGYIRGDRASLRPDQAGEMTGLAARTGAHVQDPVARLWFQRRHDERGGLILHREPSL